MNWTKLLVCLIAGLGAGVGTGFAGMSAAAVISPMLITFLNVPAYEAIGIALASDVLASAGSAITYAKKKNIDIKGGLVLLATVLLFTALGSYLGSLVNMATMESSAMVMTLFLGVRFLVSPVMTTKDQMLNADKKTRVFRSLLSGAGIGLICGFVGAGGGMMMLLVLTSILGYELKTAVGTSVFIMTFTALTGSVSHFVLGNAPDALTLALCVVFTYLFARLSARIANRADPKVLNRTLGILLVLLSIVILMVECGRKFAWF